MKPWLAPMAYAEAVLRAGGVAVAIPPVGGPADVRRLLEAVDGLLLGGGDDFDMERLGLGPTHPAAKRTPAAKQDLDVELARVALEGDLPVLGICRGAQLMNVALGGSLYQDIGHFYSEETGNIRSVLPRKTVVIAEDSELSITLGTLRCKVNALHDQSIRELGDQLVVCAREDSGVIQAIERRGHPFFIGVQWHPEYMPQRREQVRLFRHLVRQAGKTGTRSVA